MRLAVYVFASTARGALHRRFTLKRAHQPGAAKSKQLLGALVAEELGASSVGHDNDPAKIDDEDRLG